MKKVVLLISILSIAILFIFTGCVYLYSEPTQFMVDMISGGRHLIETAFPEAELSFYTAIGSIEEQETGSRGAKTVQDIISWRFVFNCDISGEQKTAEVRWLEGLWQTPFLVNDIWIEDMVIDEPVFVAFDLNEAISILRMAGFSDTPADLFDWVVFRKPLSAEEFMEPYYIFTVGPGQYVWIGAITGEVLVSD